MAPLQKRAFQSFIGGLILTIALVIVLILEGDINALDHNASIRLLVYAVMIGVPSIYLVLIDLTLKGPTESDERDKLILLKSSRIQLLVVVLTLLAWMITLTEIYREANQVPVVFLSLIMVSTLIMMTLSQSLGILIYYWREG